MERAIQPGDYVITTHEDDSQLYLIERMTPEEIGIALVSDTTQKEILVPKNGEWTIEGFPSGYGIEFRAKENVPQPPFTQVPEIDMKILNELDDKTLSLVCQLDKYTASLCQRDDLWRNRIEKYIQEKGDEDGKLEKYEKQLFHGRPGDWRSVYLKLRGYYDSVWVAYEVDLQDTEEFSTLIGVYKRKKDAVDNVAGTIWDHISTNEDLHNNEEGEEEFDITGRNDIYTNNLQDTRRGVLSGDVDDNKVTFKRLEKEIATHRVLVVYGTSYRIHRTKVE